jgi:hypothetical protein
LEKREESAMACRNKQRATLSKQRKMSTMKAGDHWMRGKGQLRSDPSSHHSSLTSVRVKDFIIITSKLRTCQ